MTKSQSSNKVSLKSSALLLAVSVLSVTEAAPISSNSVVERGQPCPPFFRRETNFAQQCAPTQFARVWHSAPSTRAHTVLAVGNQNSETNCYLSILQTGQTFQQFTWVSTTGACTYTLGAQIWTNQIASHPNSNNIIATNLAGTCASVNFSQYPTAGGIPCQNVQYNGGGGNTLGITTIFGNAAPYNIGQALALAHL